MSTPLALTIMEKSARRRWVGLILLLFVAQVGLWVGAIAFVSGDASHAVVDDYDRAAVDWDERRRQERESAATGFSAAIEIDPAPLRGDLHRVVVHLRGADGRDVADADVSAIVFHQARASEAQTIELQPGPGGTYEGLAHLARPGKWQVRLRAVQGDRRFSTVAIHDLATGSARG